MATDREANQLAVMNTKDAGVPEVWAKATSSTHARILDRVGVARVLSPEYSVGDIIAQTLHDPLVRGSVRLTEDLHLAHVEASKHVVGKAAFGVRYGLGCLGILRGAEPIAFDPDEEIAEGESLLLVGIRPAMRTFVDHNLLGLRLFEC